MRYLKHYAIRCLLIFLIFFIASTQASAADVGISLRIGQPGFYGEIHLGDFYPVPDLIYQQPRIIYTPPNIVQQPIYLHVPRKHIKNWRRFCIQYRACDRPVYFVREQWYNDVYVPHYHQQGGYQQHQHGYPQQPPYYDSGRQYQGNYPDRHYQQQRPYNSPRQYDNRDYHDKHRHKDQTHRNGYDKHGNHDKHDKGRGRKHDD